MKSNKINEGLFKDLDKNIVSIDDPEYEQKVKDQTFKEFQKADRKSKKIAEIENWLETHVCIKASGSGPEFFLTPDKEGEYYEIDTLPGADKDNFTINIINAAYCYITSAKNNKTPLNENGELPYKFGYCSGNFEFRTIPNKLANAQHAILRDIPGTQLTSFKNFPNHIKGCLCIRNAAIFVSQHIDQYYTLPSLSTLPKNMIIEGDNGEPYTEKYAIRLNGVKGIQNFNEIPAGLHIKSGGISIYDCPDFINFEGWKDKIEAGPNCKIVIDNCINFESLKGLPDDFICQKIYIADTDKFNKIKDWPDRLNVSVLALEKNRGLNAKSLTDYPFPYDMKVGTFSSDVRYNKNISIPLPPGFKTINMHANWHYMSLNPDKDQRNQRNQINEGLFKDLDNNIVNVDDPDYENKIKDQTFKDFQEADINKRRSAIKEWICDNIYVNDSEISRHLEISDENIYFRINEDDNYSIDLYPNIKTQFEAQFTINSTKPGATASLFNESGELPYKIRNCNGHFRLDETFFNEDDEMKSFKNIPSTIAGDCYIATKRIVIPISTCPPEMNVTGELYFNCINSMDGMPYINAKRLRIGINLVTSGIDKSLTNLVGWNPMSKIDEIVIMNNNSFKSLKGLPDGFRCKKITLDHSFIKEIREWPRNLTVGLLDLSNNSLSHQSLTFSPLPTDLKAGVVIVGNQFDPTQDYRSAKIKKSKKTPILIPPGVQEFYIWNRPYDVDGSKFDSWDIWSKIDEKSFKNGEVATGKNVGYWKYMDKDDMNYLSEGAFQNIDKNTVSVDDPDYENKVKDQTFKDFQEADINRRKSVIEEWIYDNIVINPNSARPYWGAGASGSYRHLEPEDKDKYFYVDDEYRIHLLGPALSMMPSFKLTNNIANSKADTVLSEIPYEIEECQGDFDASHTHITSLKNFPKSLGKPANPELYWATVKTDKNDNWVYGRLKIMYCYGLTSLEGCPQRGVRSIDCYDCNLTSLQGAPPTIAGYIDARNNCLRSLDYCPTVIVQDSRSDFQGNYIPAGDLRAAAEKLHWEKEEVLDQISTQRKG